MRQRLSGWAKTLTALGLTAFALAAPAAIAAEPTGAGPPSIAEFLKPTTFASPRLSPSGKAIAVVRRADGFDQLVRIDLPSMALHTIYQTAPAAPAKPDAGKADADGRPRERISHFDWKTDDTLVVSVNTPAQMPFGAARFDIDLPLHLLVSADGSKPPRPLNAVTKDGVQLMELSSVLSRLPDDPADVLLTTMDHVSRSRLGLNYRVSVYRVSIADGSRILLQQGDDSVVDYGVDRRGQIVTRSVRNFYDNRIRLEGRADAAAPWKPLFDLRDSTERELSKFRLLGVSRNLIYVAATPETPADGDTTTIRTFDLKTGQLGPVLWSKPGFDAESIVQKEWTGEFIGGCWVEDVTKCDFTEPRLSANFSGLNKYFQNKRNIRIVSQSDDDSAWILAIDGPDDPGSYLLYDLKTHEMQPLFAERPELGEARLGHMRRMAFKARDGADLFAYVTTPPTLVPGTKVPLIVMPHGGPEARDAYGYDVLVQFLATRGYVVLQPNFRGSGGFGRKFAEAGYRQWGLRMHQDVVDATKALIAEGGVDAGRACIVGASYGGYEALEAAVAEPGMFRCAVDMSGISDLAGFLKWQKSFGRDSERFRYWIKAIGDPVADAPALAAASPLRAADRWSTPLLLIHGADDPIVPVEESRQMKRALDRAGKPVRYVEIAGMGHSPSIEATRTLMGELDALLAKHLAPAAAPPSQVAVR